MSSAQAPTILDNMLQSSSSLLVYGDVLQSEELLERIKQFYGDVTFVDLREEQLNEAQRSEIAKQVEKHNLVVALISESTGPLAWKEIDNLLEGELHTTRGFQNLDSVQVIGLACGPAPTDDVAQKFPARLSLESAMRPSRAVEAIA